MATMRRCVVTALAMATLVACGPRAEDFATEAPVGPTVETAAPAREPFPDCAWEQFEGAGLRLWSQRCGPLGGGAQLAVGLDGRSLILRVEGTPGDPIVALRRFEKPADAGIEAILAEAMTGAPAGATCAFTPLTDAAPDGVQRYALAPTGQTAAEYDRANAIEPAEPPCGPLGVGPVGDRYFEIQAGAPNVVAFVELGSELPIYEAATLEILP